MKNRVRIIKKEFKVDEKNKVVVCELLFTLQLLGSEAIPNIMDIPGRMAKEAVSMGDTLVCRGKARCSSDDTFDEATGKKIAESRAKSKAFKTAKNVWDCIAKGFVENAKMAEVMTKNCAAVEEIEVNHVKKLSE